MESRNLDRLAVGAAKAAELLGVSKRHLWRLTDCGLVPSVRLGHRRVYRLQALRDMLAANEWPRREGAALGFQQVAGVVKCLAKASPTRRRPGTRASGA